MPRVQNLPPLIPDQRESLQPDLQASSKLEPPGVPQTLQQEFSLVNLQIRNVNVEVGCPIGRARLARRGPELRLSLTASPCPPPRWMP